eukprot:5859146-Prymnesium_polylepis.1
MNIVVRSDENYPLVAWSHQARRRPAAWRSRLLARHTVPAASCSNPAREASFAHAVAPVRASMWRRLCLTLCVLPVRAAPARCPCADSTYAEPALTLVLTSLWADPGGGHAAAHQRNRQARALLRGRRPLHGRAHDARGPWPVGARRGHRGGRR